MCSGIKRLRVGNIARHFQNLEWSKWFHTRRTVIGWVTVVFTKTTLLLDSQTTAMACHFVIVVFRQSEIFLGTRELKCEASNPSCLTASPNFTRSTQFHKWLSSKQTFQCVAPAFVCYELLDKWKEPIKENFEILTPRQLTWSTREKITKRCVGLCVLRVENQNLDFSKPDS